ncbi:MAG: hypothetical protein Q7T21_14735 [Gallionella sp.]|nr:hypothetical protein [Gallionella sp.]
MPSIAQSRVIGPDQVHVPTYMFKLVYDEAGLGRLAPERQRYLRFKTH